MDLRIKMTAVSYNEPLSYDFPEMIKIRQKYSAEKIRDVERHLRENLRNMDLEPLRGKRIAITAGSRGITDIVPVLRVIVQELKKVGARPFVVPAMGSHGGATAAGQIEVLKSYHITEEVLSVPIVSSMRVVRIGTLRNGTPVYCDREAFQAEGIVVVNKIKPHSDFKGDHESGIVKMLGIGLGKHEGATALHSLGFRNFSDVLRETAEQFIATGKILFGVGIVQNAYEETMITEVIPAENIIERDRALQKIATREIARLLVPKIDVLIVDEIGKNISGEGMDPNVTGRPGSGLREGFLAPGIQLIIVLGIDPLSHGNGNGIGLADLTTVNCIRQIDLGVMYTNSITARVIDPVRLPLIANNAKEALATAIKMCVGVSSPQDARIVRIKNTNELDTIYISKACLDDIERNGKISVLQRNGYLNFDETGELI